MKHLLAASFLLIVLSVDPAGGEVVPYARILSDDTGFTIADGKVIVIDQMMSNSNRIQLMIQYFNPAIDGSAGTFTYLATNLNRNNFFSLPAPLRLKGNWSISNITGTVVYMMGYAMDAADFYGQTSSEIDSMQVAGGGFSGRARLDRSWPVSTRLQWSPNAQIWFDHDAVITTLPDRTNIIANAVTPTDAALMRFKHRVRR